MEMINNDILGSELVIKTSRRTECELYDDEYRPIPKEIKFETVDEVKRRSEHSSRSNSNGASLLAFSVRFPPWAAAPSIQLLWRFFFFLLAVLFKTQFGKRGFETGFDAVWALFFSGFCGANFSYLYPMESPSKKFTFKWVESRKPERYSSAAPLSPDARLRIVSERVDIIDNLVISVSIGPPNVEFIKSKDKSSWNAKDVADSVLSDKSALVKSVTSLLHFRVTSSQRLAESSLLDAHTTEIDGQPYWVYEYLVRKSPTKNVQEPSLYRHYVASTFERDGYLYSLSASTLNKQWDKMGPFLERAVSSFRLLPPTDEYVPPFKDPWRFW
ncbi:unnamed protein product [Linum tenue]|uniref:PsbP C-terminal domain-containing protein n=1 Tax=Linum tenue TaxID=586396 RepID=A0AAV0MFN7_9ROSI|nr:unnamed protein product [Linum tenue]